MRLFIPNPTVAIMIKDKHFKCQASKILLEKKKSNFIIFPSFVITLIFSILYNLMLKLDGGMWQVHMQP